MTKPISAKKPSSTQKSNAKSKSHKAKPQHKAKPAQQPSKPKTVTSAAGKKKKPSPASPVPQKAVKSSPPPAAAKKTKATPKTDIKAVGTVATVVAAVTKALSVHQAAQQQQQVASASSKLRPTINVDDLIISRSNRERRPMQFFESGNDASNSCAAELARPVVPAPSSPFKPRGGKQCKQLEAQPPASKQSAPVDPARSSSSSSASALPAPPTERSTSPVLKKSKAETRPPQNDAAMMPPPPPVAPSKNSKKKGCAKAPAVTAPAAEAAASVVDAPASTPRRDGAWPNDGTAATPAAAAAGATDASCPPAVPSKPLRHARPLPAEVVPDPTSRCLVYDDEPTRTTTTTAATAITRPPPPNPPPVPPPSAHRHPNVAVTAFVDQYASRFGVAFSLGELFADGATVAKPHVATGFLFMDGSSAVIDTVGNLTYVNAHRHRFTIRNVTGKITIPERLQKKMQILVCMRHALTAFHSTAGTPDAAPRDAVSATPEVHPAPVAWTCWERDLVGSCAGVVGTALADDATFPVYCCSTSVMKRIFAPPAAVGDDDSGVQPRQFVLSQRSAPYPGKTYYCSDGTADAD